MAKLVAFRLLAAIPMLVGLSILAFLMIHVTPGDPARLVAGADAGGAAFDAVRQELGLDRPLVTQFTSWATNAIQGDLGASLFTGRSVLDTIVNRLGITLPLVVGASIVAVVLGVGFGTLASLRAGSLVDRGLLATASLGTAVPGFWLGLLLTLVLGLQLGWFPVFGYVPPSAGWATWAHHMTLPIVALAVRPASIIARQTRNSMVEVLQSELLTSIDGRGLPRRTVILRYGLRNGLIPVTTTIGIQLALILVVSFVIERVFGFPGIGSLVIDAVIRNDYPVVQGTLILIGGTAIAIYLLVDIAYGVIDPRARPQ